MKHRTTIAAALLAIAPTTAHTESSLSCSSTSRHICSQSGDCKRVNDTAPYYWNIDFQPDGPNSQTGKARITNCLQGKCSPVIVYEYINAGEIIRNSIQVIRLWNDKRRITSTLNSDELIFTAFGVCERR